MRQHQRAPASTVGAAAVWLWTERNETLFVRNALIPCNWTFGVQCAACRPRVSASSSLGMAATGLRCRAWHGLAWRSAYKGESCCSHVILLINLNRYGDERLASLADDDSLPLESVDDSQCCRALSEALSARGQSVDDDSLPLESLGSLPAAESYPAVSWPRGSRDTSRNKLPI